MGIPTVLSWPATVTSSYSRDGYVPDSCAVEPSTKISTRPTGAPLIVNWPTTFVRTAAAPCTAVLLEFNTLFNTDRTVTPGIGMLLLSSTTPEIAVFDGSPGARPEAVNAA